jgi:single-strand DNA-binding protein
LYAPGRDTPGIAGGNHTTIVGNLVEDPEVRFTNNGTAVTNLRVAVTQRVQQDGQWRDGDTSFFKVNVWRGQAENLAESLGKGDRIMVTGRLRQRSWETPEGDKRSVTELEADEVGASLKWATAKVERTSQRGNGDRHQGQERQANVATSTTLRHSDQPLCPGAPGSQTGAPTHGAPVPMGTGTSLSGFCARACFHQDRPSHLGERCTAGDGCEPLGSDGGWPKRGPGSSRSRAAALRVAGRGR